MVFYTIKQKIKTIYIYQHVTEGEDIEQTNISAKRYKKKTHTRFFTADEHQGGTERH